MNTFTIRLPDKMRKELEIISKEENIPAGQIARESINRYITVNKFRKLRQKAIPYAEKQGIFTDEDVFRMMKK